MTVKVIETKPDASVVKRKVCRECGATLEYVPRDVKTRSWTDYANRGREIVVDITYTNNSAAGDEWMPNPRLPAGAECSICGRRLVATEKGLVGARGILCLRCVATAVHVLAECGEPVPISSRTGGTAR